MSTWPGTRARPARRSSGFSTGCATRPSSNMSWANRGLIRRPTADFYPSLPRRVAGQTRCTASDSRADLSCSSSACTRSMSSAPMPSSNRVNWSGAGKPAPRYMPMRRRKIATAVPLSPNMSNNARLSPGTCAKATPGCLLSPSAASAENAAASPSFSTKPIAALSLSDRKRSNPVSSRTAGVMKSGSCVRFRGFLRRDVAMHLRHVELLHFPDHRFQTRRRQRTRLGKQQHLLAEHHQRRNRADLEVSGQLGLFLGIHLGEHHAFMLLRSRFEDRCEAAAGAAPRRPEIHDDGIVASHYLLEIILGQCNRRHNRALLGGP